LGSLKAVLALYGLPRVVAALTEAADVRTISRTNATKITMMVGMPQTVAVSGLLYQYFCSRRGFEERQAESELGVLSTQCLDRRIPDKQTLTSEIAAWQENRNKHHAKADWQFTTADARVKLKRLYPQFE
jgi:hypothetical protein